MRKVYLAGAIFGLSDRGQNWREQAIALIPVGWEAINPNVVELDKVNAADIINGDYQTILGCDAVLARVRNPSWGTAMELAFAMQHHIPVIGWPFDRPAVLPNFSPWLLHHVTVYAPNLLDAIGELKHVCESHSRLVDSNR
jgi:nucleoside 2-deoxyribosyltransferase